MEGTQRLKAQEAIIITIQTVWWCTWRHYPFKHGSGAVLEVVQPDKKVFAIETCLLPQQLFDESQNVQIGWHQAANKA